MDKKL